jgi:hypothetical protein
MYSLPDILIMSNSMRLAGHVTLMGRKGCMQGFGGNAGRWEDNIKMQTGWDGME